VEPSGKSGELGEELQPGLKLVLSKFAPVFESPVGLPPIKAKDHAIVLKEGTSPINVRPYKYPHIQKTKIEWLVGEMLAASIIQPSVGPYSSPVLLVKKKKMEVGGFVWTTAL